MDPEMDRSMWGRLLRVQLDDQLLTDVLGDILAIWIVQELASELVAVNLYPWKASTVCLRALLDRRQLAALGSDLNHVSGA